MNVNVNVKQPPPTPRIRDLVPGNFFRYVTATINPTVYIVLSKTTRNIPDMDSVTDTIRVVGLGETEVLIVPSNDRVVALEISEIYLEDIR